MPASGPSKVSRVLGPAGGPATDPLAAADPLVRLGRAEGVPHLREAVRRVAAGPVDDAVRRDLAWLDALLADHDDHPERLADALDSPRYLGLLAAARSRQRPEGPGSGGP